MRPLFCMLLVAWSCSGLPGLAAASENPSSSPSMATAAVSPVPAATPEPYTYRRPAVRPHVFRQWTVTVSPLWLLTLHTNVTGEYQPTRHWGIVLKGHYGVFDFKDDSPGEQSFFSLEGRSEFFGSGGEIRYYPFRRSLHLAVGTTWWHVQEEQPGEDPPSWSVDLWTANLLVGKKGVLSNGFTLDGQVGMAFGLQQRDGNPGLGFESPQPMGLVRLNLGWSF